jgi:adenylate cyclase
MACPLFVQAERQRRFLRFLVEQCLAGQGSRLKGYTVGAAVFDRTDDFDPRLDSIVRVEATRLRSKLREYYESIGRLDEVRIELPKGSYQLKFEFLAADAQSGEPPPIPVLELERARAASSLIRAVPVPSDKPSLVVLPIANLCGDPDQDYFADGMTDDLITALSQLSGLLVIGRHSAFVYKGMRKDAREIARELGVRYLLEGSVRRADRRIRINVQLVEAEHGLQVWAERFDRDLEDIFALQDDVTRRIVDALELQLSDRESSALVRTRSVDVEAHDLLLSGLERYWEYSLESIEASQAFFSKALEVDPTYARAHAWLARACLFRYSTFYFDRPALCELGFHHAKKAVELNPRLPLSHSMLGWGHFWRSESLDSLNASRLAVAKGPNNADAHLFLAVVLACTGQGDEAMECIQIAMRLNPHPTIFYLWALGMGRFAQARYDDAAVAFKAGFDLCPKFGLHEQCLVATYGLLGRLAEAAPYYDSILKRESPSLIHSRWQTCFHDKELAERFREGMRRVGLLSSSVPDAELL